jgi:hypothetical protein
MSTSFNFSFFQEHFSLTSFVKKKMILFWLLELLILCVITIGNMRCDILDLGEKIMLGINTCPGVALGEKL